VREEAHFDTGKQKRKQKTRQEVGKEQGKQVKKKSPSALES
jgi:hypothetical protein